MPRARHRSRIDVGSVLVVLFVAAIVLRGCQSRRSAGPARAPRAFPHEHRSRAGDSDEPSVSRPRFDPGEPVDRATAEKSIHGSLGVPVDADPSDDTLMDEGEFLVSYNEKRRGPNWVAWRLEASDLGHSPRRDSFRPDARLPGGIYRVTPHDYAHSGYDRGHLCPFADRSASPEASSVTFLMSNIEPQVHELNAGPWEKLEAYERALALAPDASLFIVAGGVFDRDPPTIGRGVAVPRASFKIVVMLKRGQGAADVTASTRTVAAEMPNQRGVGEHDWTDFVVSIDRVEADTGYDFLTAVPAPVQAVLEARRPVGVVGEDLVDK